jgi:2-dehydropantoate 2-reductase
VTRVAIVGVGAIGGVVAAALCEQPELEVLACARTPFERVTVSRDGVMLVAEPRVLTSPGAAPANTNWVILATKAYDTAGAAGWLEALCGRDTTVAVLQNGVEHIERVQRIARGARILPVVVDCPAHRTGPGKVVMRGPMKLTVPTGDAGWPFGMLFRGTGIHVDLTDQFADAAWKKLCLNVTGVIPALENDTLRVMRRSEIAEFARALIRECILVGRAEGAELPDDLVEETVGSLQSAPPDALTSMLQDRRAGKKLEVDARNGAVVRFGVRHGIPTPANQQVLDRVAALEGNAA